MLNIPRFRTASGQRTFYGIPYLTILKFANRLMCLNAALGLASYTNFSTYAT